MRLKLPARFSCPPRKFWWRRLGPKLFLSYLVVITAGVVVAHTVVLWAAPSAFAHHILTMQEAVRQAASGGQITVNLQADLYTSFHRALDQALIWSLVGAVLAAVAVSIFVTFKIARPLQAMARVTQYIAEGHYQERVPVFGSSEYPDELTELALHFNLMADRLAHSEERRRALIGDVAHELRTPLTTIKGYIEGLVDGVLPPERETYLLICQEANRMSRLIDDLQELSRVEAGAYELHLRPLTVQALVETAIRRLEPQFREKGVTLRLALDGRLPRVMVDRDRMLQVLTNLLGNALHYTPSGGEVTVRSYRVGGEVAIAVSDTGVGIPPEHLPHIFQRFYRVDKSRSRTGGGTGIGLTIAKHLVEAHGGRIWAESPGKGQGSTFTFTLPAAV